MKAQLFCEVRIDDPFSKKTDGKLKAWRWIIQEVRERERERAKMDA